jgi:hypothetical protein
MNEIRTHIRMVALLMGSPLLILWICGCDRIAEDSSATGLRDAQSTLSDQSLAPFQTQLLELAFQTASAIPVNPHIKDRCRTQEAVAQACLKLNQPQRAQGYIEQIQDWRRGLGYADMAFYAARLGIVEESRRYLQSAAQIAGSEEIEKWRTDQIKARIAQTYAWLGDKEQAEAMETGLETFASGKVAEVQAMQGEPGSFDDQVAALERYISTGQFDAIQNALGVYSILLDRYYTEQARRKILDDKIKTLWLALPAVPRVNYFLELGDVALRHADPARAMEYHALARELLSAAQWRPEHRAALTAKLAVLRFRAGDPQTAKAERDEALVFYDSNRSLIADIYRATALRKVAESYQDMNDTPGAVSLYKRAVEEGVGNPNSRPRAEDLSAICISMAMNEVEPDAELWTRLRKIYEDLGTPW